MCYVGVALTAKFPCTTESAQLVGASPSLNNDCLVHHGRHCIPLLAYHAPRIYTICSPSVSAVEYSVFTSSFTSLPLEATTQ